MELDVGGGRGLCMYFIDLESEKEEGNRNTILTFAV